MPGKIPSYWKNLVLIPTKPRLLAWVGTHLAQVSKPSGVHIDQSQPPVLVIFQSPAVRSPHPPPILTLSPADP